jgi:hypothetical protein
MPYLSGYGFVSQAQYDAIKNGAAPADSGTNAPVVTAQQSQSTNSPVATGAVPYNPLASNNASQPLAIIKDDDGNDLPAAGTPTAPSGQQPAAASAGDDNASANPQAKQTTVLVNASSQLGNPVTPSPNVLDQYASYTYSLSWYLLTPEQYTTMAKTSKINTSAWSLLMQSGGAAVGSNRNKYFSLDYYMDNLEIESSFNNRGPSSFAELSFNITEPNGITLLQNLNNAVQDFYKDTDVTPNKAQYCMVIRFYGYDAQGNLITKITPAAGTPGTTPGVANAVVVKYFPFTINSLTFRAANKAVLYEVKGAPNSFKYGQGSALGAVPNAVELTGSTVDEILNGKETSTTVPGDTDRGSVAAPTKSAPTKIGDLPPAEQAAIVTGFDPNTLGPDGGRAM